MCINFLSIDATIFGRIFTVNDDLDYANCMPVLGLYWPESLIIKFIVISKYEIKFILK